MIWVTLILLVLAMLTGLLSVFLRPSGAQDESVGLELEQCKAGLQRIETDIAEGRLQPEEADQARLAIERRVLDLAKQQEAAAKPQQNLRHFLPIAAIAVIASIGIYLSVGAPGFDQRAVYLPGATLPSGDKATISTMTAQLSERLAKEPDAPLQVYLFLARAQWGDGQRDASLATYVQAIERFPDAPALRAELQQMQAIASGAAPGNAPQISEDQRSAIAAMTPEQQAEMISGMVSRLAARLEDNPQDLEGWLRLIRARAVMGDTDQALTDLASARAVFSGDAAAQQALDQIAATSGLAE